MVLGHRELPPLSPRALAIVQARTGSTRLPRKVFEELKGETMLARVVRRVGQADHISEVVVATTSARADDPIAELAQAKGWRLTRGAEDDVLDRYRQAAEEHDAELIVRVCSDCPMTSPVLIDAVVNRLSEGAGVDYAANNFAPATYPKGLDVEAFTRDALEEAWRDDARPDWREHVTPYLRQHPGRFKHGDVRHCEDLSDFRWTVDTPEDLAFIRCLIDAVPDDATWLDCVELQRAHPEWSAINQHIQQRVVSR